MFIYYHCIINLYTFCTRVVPPWQFLQHNFIYLKKLFTQTHQGNSQGLLKLFGNSLTIYLLKHRFNLWTNILLMRHTAFQEFNWKFEVWSSLILPCYLRVTDRNTFCHHHLVTSFLFSYCSCTDKQCKPNSTRILINLNHNPILHASSYYCPVHIKSSIYLYLKFEIRIQTWHLWGSC